MAQAQELAGDRIVEVAAGDVGGHVFSAGLVDEVRMDLVPVVFGSGKRYFSTVHSQDLLGGFRRGGEGRPGDSSALPSAPPTDLSWRVIEATANDRGAGRTGRVRHGRH